MAVYNTLADFDHIIGISLGRLRMVLDAQDLRNFRSKFPVVKIRDQHIKTVRFHATSIVNIKIFTTLFSLLPPLFSEKV